MATQTEGAFKIGGTELYTKTWTPQGPIKAKLVFIHGFSDHIGRYYDLFPTLASRGVQVFGFDQRGWGRSVRTPSEKGFTGPTSLVLSDMAAFIKDKLSSPDQTPGQGQGQGQGDGDAPLFLMGNSMGGGQVATFASDPAYRDLVSQIRGLILEAPFIAFVPGEEPSFVKVFVGKLAARLLPRHQLVNTLNPEYLSRDLEVARSITEDALCHDTGTLEGLAGMLDRTDKLASGSIRLDPKVASSLLVAHGSGDRITSPAASRKWFESQAVQVQDATYKSYEGAYHQLHSDLCKKEFIQDVGDWILERLQPRHAGPEPKL